MPRGRIYVLQSLSQVGFVKVGKTARNPDERAKELDATGLALPLELAYEIVVDEFDVVESKSHLLLNAFRVRRDREWFRCGPFVAIHAIKRAVAETVGSKIWGEILYMEPEPETTKVCVSIPAAIVQEPKKYQFRR